METPETSEQQTIKITRIINFIDDIVSSYFGEMNEVVKSRNPHSDPGFQLALAEILNNYSFLFVFVTLKQQKWGGSCKGYGECVRFKGC